MSQSLRTAGLRPPWQPGQSGHTAGSARGAKRVLAIARRASPEAMEVAVRCMRDESASWRERLAAVAMILDRAWGRPKEHVSFDGADGMNITIITGVPRNGDDAPVANETTYTIEYDADDVPTVSHETKE